VQSALSHSLFYHIFNFFADIEWKLTYVGCAEDASFDQVLEEVLVGPIVVGEHTFVLQAPAPNHALIQNQDILGVTVVLLTCEQKMLVIFFSFVNCLTKIKMPFCRW
jgi:hypothetical protein